MKHICVEKNYSSADSHICGGTARASSHPRRYESKFPGRGRVRGGVGCGGGPLIENSPTQPQTSNRDGRLCLNSDTRMTDTNRKQWTEGRWGGPRLKGWCFNITGVNNKHLRQGVCAVQAFLFFLHWRFLTWKKFIISTFMYAIDMLVEKKQKRFTDVTDFELYQEKSESKVKKSCNDCLGLNVCGLKGWTQQWWHHLQQSEFTFYEYIHVFTLFLT